MQLGTALNSYPADILPKLERQRIPCATFSLLSPPKHMVKIDTWRGDISSKFQRQAIACAISPFPFPSSPLLNIRSSIHTWRVANVVEKISNKLRFAAFQALASREFVWLLVYTVLYTIVQSKRETMRERKTIRSKKDLQNMVELPT